MSRGGNQPKTHNVGERISGPLRPPILRRSTWSNWKTVTSSMSRKVARSHRRAMPARGSRVVPGTDLERPPRQMADVCRLSRQGHDEGHYKQFDDVVALYNEKFAKPIAAVMAELKAPATTPDPFDEKIEWTWWEIWHHEGRRARHGASMNGPDYTWWHGLYGREGTPTNGSLN